MQIERRFYQKITDIYAECSIDYQPKSEITQLFYKTVQNKMRKANAKTKFCQKAFRLRRRLKTNIAVKIESNGYKK
ncbi:RhuM family protein [Gaoshiqia sp. Z1-71]|uniref:RhuM family protein n=1 Tax=Gaoshiqia hydrogeniformans TaxID=3290090 RepID=UPI003BF8B64B